MLLRLCKHVHHAAKPIRVKPPCATKSAFLQTAARAQSGASVGTKWYAVRQGKRVGIFTSWAQVCAVPAKHLELAMQVEPLVIGWAGSQYKSFKSLEDAKLFLGAWRGRGTHPVLGCGIGQRGKLHALCVVPMVGSGGRDTEKGLLPGISSSGRQSRGSQGPLPVKLHRVLSTDGGSLAHYIRSAGSAAHRSTSHTPHRDPHALLHCPLMLSGASAPLPPAHVAVVLKPDACYPRLGPHNTQGGKDFLLYFDGGSRGNPGVAGFGALMKEADSKAVVRADEDIEVAGDCCEAGAKVGVRGQHGSHCRVWLSVRAVSGHAAAQLQVQVPAAQVRDGCLGDRDVCVHGLVVQAERVGYVNARALAFTPHRLSIINSSDLPPTTMIAAAVTFLALLAGPAAAFLQPTAPLFRVDKQALDGSKVAFTPRVFGNATNKYAGSWLGFQLSWALYEPIFAQLNSTAGVAPLVNRGDVYITTISTAEYAVLSSLSSITIQDINAIAMASDIQASSFVPHCVARFRKSLVTPAVVDEAYNVPASSADLVAIRQRVSDLYQMLGGEPGMFNPTSFLPHITLGFSRRNMGDADGVFKGENACWAPISLVYAVRQGKRVGIFTSWAQVCAVPAKHLELAMQVEPLVIGWAGSQYKSFKSLEDAKLFLGGRDTEKGLLPGISSSGRQSRGGQGPLPVKLHRVLSTDGASAPLPPAHVAVVLKPDACYPRLGPHNTQGGKDFLLYFDGGSRGNPGVAGFGAVMKEADSKAVVFELAGTFKAGDHTNNQAEYLGLIEGLRVALCLGVQRLLLLGDSQLVARHLQGLYQAKSMAAYYREAVQLAAGLEHVTIKHIPRWEQQGICHETLTLTLTLTLDFDFCRADNHEADLLSNVGMDCGELMLSSTSSSSGSSSRSSSSKSRGAMQEEVPWLLPPAAHVQWQVSTGKATATAQLTQLLLQAGKRQRKQRLAQAVTPSSTQSLSAKAQRARQRRDAAGALTAAPMSEPVEHEGRLRPRLKQSKLSATHDGADSGAPAGALMPVGLEALDVRRGGVRGAASQTRKKSSDEQLEVDTLPEHAQPRLLPTVAHVESLAKPRARRSRSKEQAPETPPAGRLVALQPAEPSVPTARRTRRRAATPVTSPAELDLPNSEPKARKRATAKGKAEPDLSPASSTIAAHSPDGDAPRKRRGRPPKGETPSRVSDVAVGCEGAKREVAMCV
ncbi:hypothetical protein QJQ45_023423 [Haematococcus lacustris]|nr:hypothetical protein QJQ45_023423 [Haematococcus lacustris]